jgi:predicted  nucleic acid-binding Zn-ribbon protein
MAEFEAKMTEKNQELAKVVTEIDRVNQELTNATATAHQTAEEIEALRQQKHGLEIDIHKLSALMILLRK